MLENWVDPNGKYTVRLNLDTGNRIVGPIGYDMILQTDISRHQIQAEGNTSASGRKMQISLYADDEFIAVSSEELLSGHYYGITYDSFSEDIRSIPLLGSFIGNRVLNCWDSSVQNIQEQMRRVVPLAQFQRIPQKRIRMFSLGVLNWPSTIETRSITMNEVLMECQAISYHAGSEQLKNLFPDATFEGDPDIEVTFYLCEKNLVYVQLAYICEDRDVRYALFLGTDPQNNEIKVEVTVNSREKSEVSAISIDTRQNDSKYTENWDYMKSVDGIQETNTLSFDWEPSTGKLELQYNSNLPAALNLQETSEGIRIKSNNFAEIIQILKRNHPVQAQITGEVLIKTSSAIAVPQYKNMDQWSIDDFFILLSGIGSLMGINIE